MLTFLIGISSRSLASFISLSTGGGQFRWTHRLHLDCKVGDLMLNDLGTNPTVCQECLQLGEQRLLVEVFVRLG